MWNNHQQVSSSSHPTKSNPTKRGKSAGRVLTSLENLQLIQEREKEKQEKAVQKEERKRLREEKAKRRLEDDKKKKEAGKSKDTIFFIGFVSMLW